MDETERFPPEDVLPLGNNKKIIVPSSSSLPDSELEVSEAQIDPRYFAPSTERKNSQVQGTKTSILFVLFEYCLKEGLLELKFPDDIQSRMFKLDRFNNASFHSHFLLSVNNWRERLSEDPVLRDRLLKQHRMELLRLTYPLPDRPGKLPIRKRGYSDKGSTRPHHQKFRSDKDTVTAVYFEDLIITEKVTVYGRRPTVTYRRLPYSERIREAIGLGLLERVGDFIIPTSQED